MKKIVIKKLKKKPLKNIMIKWFCGSLSELDVWNRADRIEFSYKPEREYTKDQYDFILEEILNLLATLHFQLLTKDDIPYLLKLIDAKPGSYERSWNEWQSYWEKIDSQERKKELSKNSFYIITDWD